ncbi:MAG: tRNA preQ1(34) S-adenosylmethionine ribosyltransferase-isomerase QueA [Candidatus Omnitrophica bacterium]|nr:tRNA preQ1(34) S-adenosylmethionine ribosyltransferase-isomerase QueA [Candidatus Omnitrophota bacterium]MBU1047913.1 tRNA preQ1(34) S-adenosylmethionine ribosyltransferase-isomerase QueA [Candidatus Omnitrophota bacterium]MBU1631082.1 tRNA preQ1(34) S-adenosylmethionine ribosyltransferase-isomerase QueA [Candidatus Omnitrophota bacterium]MBU1889349.1 tRNA preQ1(34) S-adenosylmethionine ribosyltransferase-isomerase QueA [Candidatus Omnitrophota bacterium]
MKLSDFNYELPKEFIAQEPVTPRDSSKLMVVDRKNKTIQHKVFSDIGDFLNKGDLLVINDAKVFPARLLGKKESTGGKVNVLLIEKEEGKRWKCLVQGSGRIKIGLRMVFGDGKLKGEIENYNRGIYTVNFALNQNEFDSGSKYEDNFRQILGEIGEAPIPPYITKRTDTSEERYQTVYAKKDGAIAAPTAGFHFTKELLERLKAKGISIATITLIVGRGTFNPIKTEILEEHVMDEEYFELRNEEIEKINKQIERKGRIIAVGTTSVRTLESAFKNGKISKNMGKTSLFIYPGYKFETIDTLITNFHLPKSTLLLLTCAFGGRELILRAYQEAIKKNYRFYSFGDAMLIL